MEQNIEHLIEERKTMTYSRAISIGEALGFCGTILVTIVIFWHTTVLNDTISQNERNDLKAKDVEIIRQFDEFKKSQTERDAMINEKLTEILIKLETKKSIK